MRAVAALFLERQHLGRPRARPLTPRRLVRFVEDVGGLQVDSINVVDRAHYLTLWSRGARPRIHRVGGSAPRAPPNAWPQRSANATSRTGRRGGRPNFPTGE
ncbi:MAG TPA: hypothetical protein VGW35_10395, partial [Methylomirabilota bacterium]|nr:hypothetical protein [Methylomirabilota bacterium]HEV8675299.1 hypothetical protein [Methylomirabilota bacterium]